MLWPDDFERLRTLPTGVRVTVAMPSTCQRQLWGCSVCESPRNRCLSLLRLCLVDQCIVFHIVAAALAAQQSCESMSIFLCWADVICRAAIPLRLAVLTARWTRGWISTGSGACRSRVPGYHHRVNRAGLGATTSRTDDQQCHAFAVPTQFVGMRRRRLMPD